MAHLGTYGYTYLWRHGIEATEEINMFRPPANTAQRLHSLTGRKTYLFSPVFPVGTPQSPYKHSLNAPLKKTGH